jgi:hypothetical protein
VRYEDILLDPRKHFAEMARFAELSPTDQTLSAAVGRVNASRGRAFASDPALAAFFEQVKNDSWMARYDYR